MSYCLRLSRLDHQPLGHTRSESEATVNGAPLLIARLEGVGAAVAGEQVYASAIALGGELTVIDAELAQQTLGGVERRR